MASQVNWLYVDLNSYFASVEQHLNPKLRGRPVVVVPTLVDTTCVIAASYEAKKFGIKTGTLVAEAKKLCSGLTLICGDHGEYVRYHKKIVGAIESCHPVTAVMSIDEVACSLGGRDRNVENAKVLSQEIKNKIYERAGESFSCSIGLGPNRFLAKVASDMQKPNGLTVILSESLPHQLYSLKLRDLIGIGARMEARLHRAGVYTVEQLCAMDIHHMRSVWGGIGGEYFYRWIRGEDFDLESESNKSIGHQHVLPPEYRSLQGAYRIGQKLLNKAAVRLRKIRAWTRKLSVTVKFVNRTYWSRDVRILECQDTFTLQAAFDQAWSSLRAGTPIKISVTLSDFVFDSERTFSFFEDDKKIKLSHVMDRLNQRYGRNTIYLGSIHEVLSPAPSRIAFSSIPEEDI